MKFQEITVDLCYDATSIDDACCDCGVLVPSFIDSSDFLTATAVYDDANLTVKSVDGYYQSGGDYRLQLNGFLGPAVLCEECGIACGGTLSPPGGADGLYQLTFSAGTDPADIGAILVYFDPKTLSQKNE